MPTQVQFDVTRPASYQPVQLLLRVVLLALLAMIGTTLGWIFGVLYLALPLFAAAMVSTRGAAAYRDEMAPRLVRALRWLLALNAYVWMLTDRAPVDEASLGIRYEVEPSGAPTVRSALLHFLTSIPAVLFLFVLGLIASLLWVVAAILILVDRTVPQAIYDFQRGLLRLYARFLAHHASLVEGAAPVSFDTGPAAGATPTDAPRAVV